MRSVFISCSYVVLLPLLYLHTWQFYLSHFLSQPEDIVHYFQQICPCPIWGLIGDHKKITFNSSIHLLDSFVDKAKGSEDKDVKVVQRRWFNFFLRNRNRRPGGYRIHLIYLYIFTIMILLTEKINLIQPINRNYKYLMLASLNRLSLKFTRW